MSLVVTALVLLAALLHATWNALIKASRDSTLDTALLVGAASLVCAPLLLLVPAPEAASWPFLVASWLVHQLYFAMVGVTYRRGDLSLTYPLMRGLPPLVVAGFASAFMHEAASPLLWFGVISISTGVLWIAGFGRVLRLAPERATTLALVTALLIAAYTLIDAMGVRRSGSASSYGLWLFVLIANPYVWIVIGRRRDGIGTHLRRHGWRSVLGALFSIVAYLIALWAMAQAPVAAVAALRETSVIFAAMIGAWLFKEPFGRHRIAAACLVALGIAMLRG
jgi:drug/metabolite transporter (DMT)-like permease